VQLIFGLKRLLLSSSSVVSLLCMLSERVDVFLYVLLLCGHVYMLVCVIHTLFSSPHDHQYKCVHYV
jgi:hypothetical protein